MAVRRLATEQPASFAFSSENDAWAKKQIAKYPEGRQASAIIPLLWQAQKQVGGWLPEVAIRHVADLLDMPHIRALEVATFYTMFNLEPVGKHYIQLCGTTPCMLRGAEALKEVCHRRIGEQRHVTADGNFSWLEVECLGACVNAPMVQINDDYFEDLTPASLEKLMDDLAAGRKVKVGPQTDRQYSAPSGGLTSLNGKNGAGPAKAGAEPPLTDAAPKKPNVDANRREAPAPADQVVKAAPSTGASAAKTAAELETNAPPRKPKAGK
jgi:NADH-quinone oxidoreductase subunit E